MISGNIYVGTAAWANPPAERKRRAAKHSHLEHYASHFNAVEINSSFYRRHQRVTYERWASLTPKEFRFSVKAPRSVTHECALRHCKTELQQFLSEVAGLGSKLRVILVQTPPSLIFESRVVSRFFTSLRSASSAQIACEPRHPSWFTADAEATLRRREVARVAADPAKPAGALSPGGSDRLLYYRLHGSPRMYYSAYNDAFLNTLAGNFTASSSKLHEIWCVFDNTARYAAWGNALDLRRVIAQHTPMAGKAHTS